MGASSPEIPKPSTLVPAERAFALIDFYAYPNPATEVTPVENLLEDVV